MYNAFAPHNKRKFVRIRCREELFVALFSADGSKSGVVGKVIDISSGGLGFFYLSEEGRAKNITHMQLFKFGHTDIHSHKIRCRMVYDFPVANKFYLGPTLIRRGAISF